jgi:hypothetical protein
MDETRAQEERLARHVNVALAWWLLISAFTWRHGRFHFVVAWVVSAFVVALAPLVVGPSRVRPFNAAAGLALAAVGLTMPRVSAISVWNVVIGLAITALSLLPPQEFRRPHALPARRGRQPRRAHRPV